MLELFEEKQWVGEFFVPDRYNERFTGKIDYSPENGVVLSYSITEPNVPCESKVIHGVLAIGDKCTLIGQFSPQLSGFTIKNGLYVRHGNSPFSCLLIGDFLSEDELIYDINFSLTNLQEFFFPKGYKDLLKYSEKPLLSIKTCYGTIEVGNDASFGFLHKDISAQIYSRNEDALRELKDSFVEIEKKYPDALFMLKQDITYRISLKIDAGATVIPTYKHISDLSNLFALLIYGPVYPDSIRIIKKIKDDYPSSIELYPSLPLNKRTMEMCIKDRSHFHMPITNSKIDLASTFSKWLNSPQNYSTIISSIQNETGFRDEHSLHGEIVLYATQFEAISYDASITDKKYEYPLETHGTPKIRSGIQKIFQAAGESDIGKAIGDVRNEIAHIGRPKKLLNALSMKDMSRISQYLQITIVGYILGNIGIDRNVITEYQDCFTPQA